MKEIIIVAGENKIDVGRLRCSLKMQGYSLIFCKTLKELIGELKILPVCSVRVSLVIIEPEMLISSTDDLVTELSECAPDVRFVLLNGDNILLSVEELLSGSMQHLTTTGSELSKHVFRTQCTKILEFAELELLELAHGTSDAQTVLTMSSAMVEIADLAAQMVKPEVKALAEKATDLLEDIQHNKQCVISNVHKESLRALLDAIKQHVLNGNKIHITSN